MKKIILLLTALIYSINTNNAQAGDIENDDTHEQWYGYYEVEVDLPYIINPERTKAAYRIDFKEDKCLYYNLRLENNEIFDCEVVEATPEYISFESSHYLAPDTEGEPLAKLHKKDGKYYISGPFFYDENDNSNILFEAEKKKDF